ncbi:hypothetical protein MJO28_014307 [Puccinia striiformis f. sp. tritici]|uniref:Uncharacterized protein n=2 Tax=Puccinia striiformis TaxID=27350 RepID=A0A2S4WDW0_9BASI|nr:hypothetical protein MJO28_014307 [Puccinia striiformis f. sp. tritici]KAI7939440.1 hypothetical protein MJO29_014176 [Puccinia striiformis f. sp. tritici]POW19929.1 hypothetical protein PSHT_04071 [Puccinia striiformis]
MVTPSESYTIRGASSSEVGGAWGAAYAVGTPISALVTGICCALAIEYFQQFPRDAARIRISVITVVATTIFGLLLAMDLTYVRLVKNATPPGGLGDIPWQDDAVALICGICQLICSAYFAYSAYSVATKKKLLIVWYGLLMAVIFLSAFFRAILGLTPTDWSDGAALCPKMTYLWLICSLLLDFSIAVTLLTHLRKAVPTPPLHTGSMPAPGSLLNHPSNAWVLQQQQAPLLSRLLTTILTSFSLTAILMFSLLCLVLAMHGTEFDPQLPKATGIFTALRLLATPTYAVTFLYTLNRRNRRDAVYHNSILTGRMPALTPRVSHNTNFGFQPPGLQVDLPATEVKHNWTQMLGTASTRSTRTRIGKDSMTKLYFPEAFKNFSSVSFRKSTNQTKPRFPEPPPPVHVNEPQPGLMRQTESPVQNFDSLDHGHISGHRRSLSQHSSVIQIHHGTAI